MGSRNVYRDDQRREGEALAKLFHRTYRQRKAAAIATGGDYTQQDFAHDLGMNYKTVNRILLARELYTEQLSTLKALSRLIGRATVLRAIEWPEDEKDPSELERVLLSLAPPGGDEREE